MDLGRVAALLGVAAVRHVARIQELWSGYGELVRVVVPDGTTAIVKWARPPDPAADDASARRKRHSFEVEAAFYRTLAPRCDDSCRVPALLANAGGPVEGAWILVLEDLDRSGYAERVDEATGWVLDAVLAWLARFHARFLGERCAALWPLGSYWQLATRRDELAAIEDPRLRDAAESLADRLAAARFQTVLHGDPKEANFCVDPVGQRVAAVDFQYAGHGCGMVDVAYLLHGRADEPADGIHHAHLDRYFAHLRGALPAHVDAAALETEWRGLYPIARLDLCRFLAGWRPALWRRDFAGRRFASAMLGARGAPITRR